MQIHELTYRKVNEANVPAEIGKALANKFTQSQIGVDAFDRRTPAAVGATATAKAGAPAKAAQQTEPKQPVKTTQKTAQQEIDVPVQPGHRLKVVDPKTKAVFYKSEDGRWTNESGQHITNLRNVRRLEQLADGGAGFEEPIPSSTGTVVKPGNRLKVVDPRTKGVYYKTADQGWYNELGQRITHLGSIDRLEQLADGGAGLEEPIPTVTPKPKIKTPTSTPITTTPALPQATAKPAAQPAAAYARRTTGYGPTTMTAKTPAGTVPVAPAVPAALPRVPTTAQPVNTKISRPAAPQKPAVRRPATTT